MAARRHNYSPALLTSAVLHGGALVALFLLWSLAGKSGGGGVVPATSLSDGELGALRGKLEKLWNPNCAVEGAQGVVVKVRMRLTPEGRLAAPPELVNRAAIDGSGNAVLIASAQRAVSAVGRGQPY